MSSLISRQINYFPTESDLAELFSKAGLPQDFSNKFIRDYAAMKRNVGQSAAATDGNTLSIESLDARVVTVEAQIVALDLRVDTLETEVAAIDIRLTTAEGEIDTLRIDLDQLRLEFDGHVAATEAHGALGDIVGRENYPIIDSNPLDSLAGVVFTALHVANVVPSTISPPSSIGAAGILYDQAYAQSQTDAINSLSSELGQLKNEYNNAVIQINLLLENMRIAKQLETP